MLKPMTTPGSPVQSAVRDWLALNRNELIWIALVGGGVAFVGLFMGPAGLVGP